MWRSLYYGLPNVYDMGKATLDMVNGKRIESLTPMWSSAVFGVVVLGAALYVFRKRDF